MRASDIGVAMSWFCSTVTLSPRPARFSGRRLDAVLTWVVDLFGFYGLVHGDDRAQLSRRRA